MNWESNHINIGTVISNTKIEVTFLQLPPYNTKIKSINTSCGCSVAKFSSETNELKVLYTPDKVPIHLKESGYYISKKTITITYRDNSEDKLSFSARVIDKIK